MTTERPSMPAFFPEGFRVVWQKLTTRLRDTPPLAEVAWGAGFLLVGLGLLAYETWTPPGTVPQPLPEIGVVLAFGGYLLTRCGIAKIRAVRHDH